jgi:hypothetical protein
MKAVDRVREQGDAELSPTHQQVGVMALALRDLAEPVRQRKGLAEVLHPEVALEVVTADQRPIARNLSPKALDSFSSERRNAALAGNALPPGEVLAPDRFVVHVDVP